MPTLGALALAFIPQPALAAQAPDTIDQHWELTSESITAIPNVTDPTIYAMSRQAFPRTSFDPVPTASIVVVAKVTAGTSGSWSVDLRSLEAGGGVSFFTPITIPATTSVPTKFSASVPWPSYDKQMSHLRLQASTATAGTLTISKIYLNFRQVGIIKKTVGRVTMGTRQSQVVATSFTDVQDPYLFTYNAADFDPAPTEIAWRANANVSACQLTLELKDVTSGLQVATQHFFPAGVPQEQYVTEFGTSTGTLENGHQYKVRQMVTTSCFGGGDAPQGDEPEPDGPSGPSPTGDFLSSDLQFTQATADPQGLVKTVGWYSSVSAATDVTGSGALGYLMDAPAITIPNAVQASYSQTVKVLTGTGTISTSLYDGGTALVSGTSTSTTSYAEFSVAWTPPVSLLSGSHLLDTRVTLGTGTTGRVSATLLKYILALRDVSPPVFTAGSVSWTNTAFSPVLPTSNPKSKTTLSFTLTDYSSATVDLSLSGPTSLTVTGLPTAGSGLTKTGSWVWDGRNNGSIVPDGIYTATITATDGAGNGSAPFTVSQTVTVDTVAPTISNFAVATSPVTSPMRFSPNGDGYLDSATYTASFSEPVSCTLYIASGPNQSCSGTSLSWAWTGSGVSGVDGTYSATIVALDAAGNGATSSPVSVIRDTVGPVITNAAIKAKACSTCPLLSTTAFSPNGDGAKDTAEISATLSDSWTSVDWTTTIKNSANNVVRTFTGVSSTSPLTVTPIWDGKDEGGILQRDGTYTISLTARDAGLNTSLQSLTVLLDTIRPTVAFVGPSDNRNTMFASMPLVAVVEDGLSGLDSSTAALNFGVWGSNTYTPVNFTIAAQVLKSTSVSLAAGTKYDEVLDIADLAGNSVTKHGAFLATTATTSVPSVSLAPLAASSSSGDALTTTYIWNDVPVTAGSALVTLGASIHAGPGTLMVDVGTQDLNVSYNVGGVPLTTHVEENDIRSIRVPYLVSNASTSTISANSTGHTGRIGRVFAVVPSAASNVRLTLATTARAARFPTCADVMSQSQVRCSPDPLFPQRFFDALTGHPDLGSADDSSPVARLSDDFSPEMLPTDRYLGGYSPDPIIVFPDASLGRQYSTLSVVGNRVSSGACTMRNAPGLPALSADQGLDVWPIYLDRATCTWSIGAVVESAPEGQGGDAASACMEDYYSYGLTGWANVCWEDPPEFEVVRMVPTIAYDVQNGCVSNGSYQENHWELPLTGWFLSADNDWSYGASCNNIHSDVWSATDTTTRVVNIPPICFVAPLTDASVHVHFRNHWFKATKDYIALTGYKDDPNFETWSEVHGAAYCQSLHWHYHAWLTSRPIS